MAVIAQRNNIVTHDEIPAAFKMVSTHAKANTSFQSQTESLRNFMEATTLHGARFLCSGYVFRRLLWSVALVSSFAFCIYQVYVTVDAFYGRPFNTKITKIANKNHPPFPAVTICNYNSFNRRRYKNEMTNSEDAERDLNFITEMIAGSKTAFTNESRKQHPDLFSRKYGDVQVEDHFFALFSHRIEEMLLPSPTFESCDINGVVCDSKNFTSFISTVFGRCYTFNSGHNQHAIVNATMAGHLNGLKLLLNVEKDSYLDNPVNPLVGLKILVHDQHTFPFMEQFGFAVQPGVRTLCAIKRKKV